MKRLTPCRAIRKYCGSICSTTSQEATKCHNTECPLFAYREGHNPSRKGMSPNADLPRSRTGRQFCPSGLGRKKILREKVIHDKEILIEGKYRLVKVEDDE